MREECVRDWPAVILQTGWPAPDRVELGPRSGRVCLPLLMPGYVCMVVRAGYVTEPWTFEAGPLSTVRCAVLCVLLPGTARYCTALH